MKEMIMKMMRMKMMSNQEDDSPCPDDDNYPCSQCGNDTGNGYDGGLCCECLGE